MLTAQRPESYSVLVKRPPFVWEVQLFQDVLDDAVNELAQLPFAVLRRIVHTPLKKSVLGRNGKKRRLTITAEQPGGVDGAVHVVVQLRRGWFGQALTHGFTVNPPNEPGAIDDHGPPSPFADPTAPATSDDHQDRPMDALSDDFFT